MNNGTHIKDGVIYSGGATSADQIAYDNTNSDLEATNTQEAVDELSSDLTELKSDSGWISLFTSTTGGFINYRKRNNLVELEFGLNAVAIAVADWTTLGTLPEGYRPRNRLYQCFHHNERTASWQDATVFADGRVMAIGNASVGGSLMYFVD